MPFFCHFGCYWCCCNFDSIYLLLLLAEVLIVIPKRRIESPLLLLLLLMLLLLLHRHGRRHLLLKLLPPSAPIIPPLLLLLLLLLRPSSASASMLLVLHLQHHVGIIVVLYSAHVRHAVVAAGGQGRCRIIALPLLPAASSILRTASTTIGASLRLLLPQHEATQLGHFIVGSIATATVISINSCYCCCSDALDAVCIAVPPAPLPAPSRNCCKLCHCC